MKKRTKKNESPPLSEQLRQFIRDAPVAWGQLADAVSPDTNPNQETIKGYVSKARTILRTAFSLDQQDDPIPNVEWGQQTSWKLDSEVLRRATEKQR